MAIEPADADLVTRARGGDLAAFGTLLHRHQAKAARVAAAIAGPDDAEDVVQEAFVRAHHAIARFRPGEEVAPWLLTIVANQARNHRRAAGRRQALWFRVASGAATSTGSLPADEEVLVHERRQAVLDAVLALPPKHRLVVSCRYLLELSEAETAAVTGWPIGTVKSRLARGLRRLQDELSSVPGVESEHSDG